jgi:ribonuclease HI
LKDNKVNSNFIISPKMIENKKCRDSIRDYYEIINVYTDGSCMKKKNGIICGYGIHFPQKIYGDISEPFIHGKRTNNRAELFAILIAIKIVTENFCFNELRIHTDSEYSRKSFTIWIKKWKVNNWMSSAKKPVENQDIIKQIDNYLTKYKGTINIIWVKGHSKGDDPHTKGNNVADELARNGAIMTEMDSR